MCRKKNINEREKGKTENALIRTQKFCDGEVVYKKEHHS